MPVPGVLKEDILVDVTAEGPPDNRKNVLITIIVEISKRNAVPLFAPASFRNR